VKRLHFCIGKGGVGKTTVSAAYAIHLASQAAKPRVLLLSTDPAHSLADILQIKLQDEPRSVPLPKGKLKAWQINSEKVFGQFLEVHKEGILNLIDKGSMFSREDIEPLIDTTLPGMAEMSALISIRDVLSSGEYGHIVVDTAPFGHTLRLFTLPEQFTRFHRFLDLAASRDQVLADHFGGVRPPITDNLVADFRRTVEEIQNATSGDAELILVTTAEKFSLNEAVRCSATLASQTPPLKIDKVVLNRISPADRKCSTCAGAHATAQKGRAFLKKHFPGSRAYYGEDPGGPIMGRSTLAAFANHVFAGTKLKYTLPAPRIRPMRFVPDSWPVLNKPLSLVVGKGGVGKTTVSAALGFRTRKKTKQPVEICSVDPAPSLDDVFQADVGNQSEPVLGDPKFRASELDALRLFRDWIRELQSSVENATTAEFSGVHLDLSFERRLLSDLLEMVPPGVDEVLAIFRILDLVADPKQRIVIDMAPTGHALELLRMPERILAWSRPLLKTLAMHRTLALARDAGVKVAELSHRVRELSQILQDFSSTDINIVMLPEPLPDRETERLISGIDAQKMRIRHIFINRVLFEDTKCARCRRAKQWQLATLSKMKQTHPGSELLVVRNFSREIAGKAALQAFTGELWRLA
jgi:arsenite/tail-anchored protein-transporting ATPase